MKQKITIFSSEFPPGPGGIGCHAFHLADKLFQFGWDVQVITEQIYVDKIEASTFNKKQAFKIVVIPPLSSRITGINGYIISLISILKHRPSIVIGTGASVLKKTNFFSSLFKTKLVFVDHGTEFGMNE